MKKKSIIQSTVMTHAEKTHAVTNPTEQCDPKNLAAAERALQLVETIQNICKMRRIKAYEMSIALGILAAEFMMRCEEKGIPMSNDDLLDMVALGRKAIEQSQEETDGEGSPELPTADSQVPEEALEETMEEMLKVAATADEIAHLLADKDQNLRETLAALAMVFEVIREQMENTGERDVLESFFSLAELSRSIMLRTNKTN